MAAASTILSAPLVVLRTPALRRTVLKLVVGYALLFTALVIGLALLGLWVAEWLVGPAQSAEGLPSWLNWLSKMAIVVGFLLMSPMVFVLTSGLVLGLWEERLFLLARQCAGATRQPASSLGALAEGSILVRRSARALVPSVAFLALNLIPVVGSLAYVLVQAWIASAAVGWDLLDYHFDLHGYSWEQRRSFLKTNRWLVVSTGAVAVGLLLIPGLQLAFAVSNVVAAGMLSAKLDLDR